MGERLVGERLPVRITETELLVYDHQIRQVARHLLLVGQTGQRQIDPAHRPPRDQREQLELLRQRYAELGEVAGRFLEGLLKKQRCGKHQAQRVLLLLPAYHRQDVVAAMERAVQYHAYSLSWLERILGMQATPKPSWQSINQQQQQEALHQLSPAESIPPRSTAEYQYLLFEENDPDVPPALLKPCI